MALTVVDCPLGTINCGELCSRKSFRLRSSASIMAASSFDKSQACTPWLCTGTGRSTRSILARQLGLPMVMTRMPKACVSAWVLTKRSTISETVPAFAACGRHFSVWLLAQRMPSGSLCQAS